jgi:hypothetical protein
VGTIEGHKLEKGEVFEWLGAVDVVAYVETLRVSPPVWAVQGLVESWLSPPVRLASGPASLSLAIPRKLTVILSVVVVVIVLATLVAVVVVGPRLGRVAGIAVS